MGYFKEFITKPSPPAMSVPREFQLDTETKIEEPLEVVSGSTAVSAEVVVDSDNTITSEREIPLTETEMEIGCIRRMMVGKGEGGIRWKRVLKSMEEKPDSVRTAITESVLARVHNERLGFRPPQFASKLDAKMREGVVDALVDVRTCLDTGLISAKDGNLFLETVFNMYEHNREEDTSEGVQTRKRTLLGYTDLTPDQVIEAICGYDGNIDGALNRELSRFMNGETTSDRFLLALRAFEERHEIKGQLITDRLLKLYGLPEVRKVNGEMKTVEVKMVDGTEVIEDVGIEINPEFEAAFIEGREKGDLECIFTRLLESTFPLAGKRYYFESRRAFETHFPERFKNFQLGQILQLQYDKFRRKSYAQLAGEGLYPHGKEEVIKMGHVVVSKICGMDISEQDFTELADESAILPEESGKYPIDTVYSLIDYCFEKMGRVSKHMLQGKENGDKNIAAALVARLMHAHKEDEELASLIEGTFNGFLDEVVLDILNLPDATEALLVSPYFASFERPDFDETEALTVRNVKQRFHRGLKTVPDVTQNEVIYTVVAAAQHAMEVPYFDENDHTGDRDIPFIVGGPGTGKTELADFVVESVRSMLPEDTNLYFASIDGSKMTDQGTIGASYERTLGQLVQRYASDNKLTIEQAAESINGGGVSFVVFFDEIDVALIPPPTKATSRSQGNVSDELQTTLSPSRKGFADAHIPHGKGYDALQIKKEAIFNFLGAAFTNPWYREVIKKGGFGNNSLPTPEQIETWRNYAGDIQIRTIDHLKALNLQSSFLRRLSVCPMDNATPITVMGVLTDFVDGEGNRNPLLRLDDAVRKELNKASLKVKSVRTDRSISLAAAAFKGISERIPDENYGSLGKIVQRVKLHIQSNPEYYQNRDNLEINGDYLSMVMEK